MRYFRTAYRLVVIFVMFVVGVIFTLIVQLSGQQPRPTWALYTWSRMMCKAIGVRVNIQGRLPTRRHLVLSNHISWVDILVLATIQPGHFLSKAEVANWPVLGWMVRQNGTLFISRGKGMSQAQAEIAERLQQGHSVTFFPEATTTRGYSVRRFFPHMISAAHQADALIQPILLAYVKRDKNGKLEVNEAISYVEGTSIVGIAMKILGDKHTQVRVTVLEPYQPKDISAKGVAKAARAQLLEAQSALYDHRYDEYQEEIANISRS